MPFFTVLMPAYNAAPFLREAIDSVLAQTFPDFELLIVNDGSTDATAAILETYTDPRIRIHHQPNQGVIGALNAGLERAQGTYIARFDADDVCYPQRLAVQAEYFRKHPDCVLLGSAADAIDEEGNFLFEWQPDAYELAGLQQVILEACPFDHPTVAYPRTLALQLGGYPNGAIHFEDHLFWTAFLRQGPVANLKEPLIQHRFNAQSVTIDEKWRGPEFKAIKYRAIQRGSILPEEADRLRDLVKLQDLTRYKKAAYHAMMGKKYLWNRYDPAKARRHLVRSLRILPTKAEPYLLLAFSVLPQSWIAGIYKKMKS
ncbi:MAG: glycosyltransferase family 2 protein [Sphingobacteriales bacterium]|nr:MAG: glycosyltransferase family 2 protein [Sphingobacteriales bacterium]